MSLIARDWTQETRFSRVILAVFVGATVGASLDAASYLFHVYDWRSSEHFAEFAVSRLQIAFVYSYFGLLVGISLFGLPVWTVLHKTGRRRWQHAAITGALVPFVIYLALATRLFTGRASGHWSYFGEGGDQWIDGEMTRFGLMIAIKSASQIAFLGVFIGLVIWRVAYRRVEGQG